MHLVASAEWAKKFLKAVRIPGSEKGRNANVFILAHTNHNLDIPPTIPQPRPMEPKPSIAPSAGDTAPRHPSPQASAYPARPRNPPPLPTATERLVLALFPGLLLFGTLYSLVSPQTRGSAFDTAAQAHAQDAPPSYFAHKGNVFNQWYVKKGWAWTSLAFAALVAGHPAMRTGADVVGRRVRAILRWGLVTGWWILVTQWFFGPPIIDRGFRWTGGKCEVVEEMVEEGSAGTGDVFTAVACKAAGGRWQGGHDISGHIFLLVLGSGFLLQELGWVVSRWTGGVAEERTVVMSDGAVKGAGVESQTTVGEGKTGDALGLGGKVVAGVVVLNLWMLLMTAIYFHTWFEKVSDPRPGLLPYRNTNP